MYKNFEGYADPTAGAALAHIAYEQRRAQKQAIHQRITPGRKEKITPNVAHIQPVYEYCNTVRVNKSNNKMPKVVYKREDTEK